MERTVRDAAPVQRHVERNVRHKSFVSSVDKTNQNLLWYLDLEDGWTYAWAAKGTPDGHVGYLGQAPRELLHALSDPTSNYQGMVKTCGITSVLTLRDENGGEKTLSFGEYHDKVMKVRCFVHVHEDLETSNGRSWATALVQNLNRRFNLRLAFGGNAADFGFEKPACLEEVFLTDDVANLAMIPYGKAVQDGTFFDNEELVGKYFLPTTYAQEVFKNLNLF